MVEIKNAQMHMLGPEHAEVLTKLMNEIFNSKLHTEAVERWLRTEKEVEVFGLELDKELVGYVVARCFEAEPENIRLLEGGLLAPYRRYGLAYSTLDYIIKTYRRKGKRLVWLVTEKSNIPARMLYQKVGFAFDTNLPKFFEKTGKTGSRYFYPL